VIAVDTNLLVYARDGFSEPQITEMPDGSLFALLRSEDGNGGADNAPIPA
jgi:hypothetical protein